MVPRADIVAVDEETSLPELIALFRDAQHSRLPVYRETLDVPTGLVHIKDVLAYMQIAAGWQLSLEGRPDLTVQARSSVRAAVHAALSICCSRCRPRIPIWRLSSTNMAAPTDWSPSRTSSRRLSATSPTSTMRTRTLIRKSEDGTIVADARTDLEDFKNETGIALAPEDADQEIDTLGGLVVSLLGRVPQRGEIVAHPSGYEFEVLEADPRRVKRLRVRGPANRTVEKSA